MAPHLVRAPSAYKDIRTHFGGERKNVCVVGDGGGGVNTYQMFMQINKYR